MELDIGWQSTPAIIDDVPVICCLYWEGGENTVRGVKISLQYFHPGVKISYDIGGWKYCITPARSSGLPKSPHAARGSQPALLDDWCRGLGMSTLKDKELHKPQFFACPPHKSIIYIHNFTYFSSTYQVHLMWNNKLLDLIWRWIQNFTTPHEINKPYDFNWTKNKCLSCVCHS